nr:hypothetical protein [Tanacetum cinerariifolium]
MRCPQPYSTDIQEVILFYKGLDVPTRQILDCKGAIPTMKAADAKNRTQIFKPNRLVVPFLSRLIDDSYEEIDVLDSATYLKKMLRERPKMRSDNEDANEHIEKVLEIVDLFHILEITQDQIMLRSFLMSLTGAASRWLRNEPYGSFITWEVLKKKFLSKYCQPARTTKKIEEINNFQQGHDETLYQAWERFNELLMRCPQPYSTNIQEVILFYKGLDVPTRQILDCKGAIPTMKAADAKKILRERPKMRYQIEASMNKNKLVVLEDPLPPKEKDPRSFALPCYINNIYFEKALVDLGASVSV